jgi:sialate O-acetylesterase
MKKIYSKSSITLILLLFYLCFQGGAQVKLPAIIGSNMVLQRSTKAPVWGWAAPGEKVTVTFNNRSYVAIADKEGKWIVKLRAAAAGGPFDMTITVNDKPVMLTNILVGEVWVASGQSNMELGIQSDSCGIESISKATDSLIHFFYVPMATSLQPEKDIAAVPDQSLNGKWVVCSPSVMATTKWAWYGFSAVGYYFAREIRKSTGNPVGMIGTYKGGTPAQSWISTDGLQQSPAFKNYVAAHQALVNGYEKAMAAWPAKQAAYNKEVQQWNNSATLPHPKGPVPPDGGFNAPGNTYNAMVAPLIPYAIKGVIWYQGESNGDKLEIACEYATLFPRLIRNWRAKWGLGNIPFLFVQLAGFRAPAVTPSEGNWAWVREAQLKALSLSATGMAVTTDIGNATDIHPKNKLDVGLRLAAAGRHVAYGEKIVYAGPAYRSMQITGDKIVLTFTNTGSGLVNGRTAATEQVKDLAGFGIAGADGKFVWAKASISGDKIVVFSSEVAQPVAVRYNWADNPPGALYNKEGFPASPFRTDSWPCAAAKKINNNE